MAPVSRGWRWVQLLEGGLDRSPCRGRRQVSALAGVLGTTWEQRCEAKRAGPRYRCRVQQTPRLAPGHAPVHWSRPRWRVGETRGPEGVSSGSRESCGAAAWGQAGPGPGRPVSPSAVRLALSGLGCPRPAASWFLCALSLLRETGKAAWGGRTPTAPARPLRGARRGLTLLPVSGSAPTPWPGLAVLRAAVTALPGVSGPEPSRPWAGAGRPPLVMVPSQRPHSSQLCGDRCTPKVNSLAPSLHLCPWLAVWPWVGPCTSLGLSVPLEGPRLQPAWFCSWTQDPERSSRPSPCRHPRLLPGARGYSTNTCGRKGPLTIPGSWRLHRPPPAGAQALGPPE